MAHRSFGTSTRTGPPRPERRRWKARRITFGSSLADVTGSADLVMFFMEREEKKLRSTQAMRWA